MRDSIIGGVIVAVLVWWLLPRDSGGGCACGAATPKDAEPDDGPAGGITDARTTLERIVETVSGGAAAATPEQLARKGQGGGRCGS